MLFQSVAKKVVKAVMNKSSRSHFASLKALADEYKPTGYDQEMRTRHLYYRGKMDDDLTQRLKKLFPETWSEMDLYAVNTMRKVVDRLAAVYLTPSSRVLLRDGEPIKADDSQSELWGGIQEQAGYHRYWKGQDRFTRLFRTTFGKAVWDPIRQCVAWRKFPPYAVWRVPDADWPEDITRDYAIILQLGSSPNGDNLAAIELDSAGTPRGGQGRHVSLLAERYEVWSRTETGWRWSIVDGTGNLLEMPEDNPEGENFYRDSQGREVLPITVLYDQEPDGTPYLDAGHDLLTVARALNVRITDLNHMIQYQAHGQWVAKVNDPKAKFVTGPGRVITLRPDDDLSVLNSNPQIDQAREAIQSLLYWHALMNNMSPNQFRVDRQALAGVALKVENLDLMEDRQDHIEVYREPEQRHFEVTRAVWNYHAPDKLDESLSLQWSPGAFDLPTDEEALQRRYLVDIREGVASRIDYAMELYGVSREEAKQILQRVAEEEAQFGRAESQAEPFNLQSALTDEE